MTMPRSAGPAPEQHTLRLTSAYGEVLADEEVAASDFPAALRRIHDQAVRRENSIVVVDGIAHTRNSFLEFVRQFNDCLQRWQRAPAAAA